MTQGEYGEWIVVGNGEDRGRRHKLLAEGTQAFDCSLGVPPVRRGQRRATTGTMVEGAGRRTGVDVRETEGSYLPRRRAQTISRRFSQSPQGN